LITNCVIESCTAALDGGAFALYQSNVTVRDCNVIDNVALRFGGGVYADGGMPTIQNVTFASNAASNSGGGLYLKDGAPAVTNSIMWDDTPDEISVLSGAPQIAYSNVEGGSPGVGNINLNPLFVDANAGDFHLSPTSPCINAGDPAFVAAAGERDIDGEPRIMDGRVDMGSDEAAVVLNPADFDGDGDVDLTDFAAFGQCFAGAGNPPAPGCPAGVDADFDNDGDVDLSDFATFAQNYTGAH
jgi:hypothetical protein